MQISKIHVIGIILLVLGVALIPLEVSSESSKKVVTKGKRVSIEYTLKLEDGSTIDTNVGGKPFTFIQGANQIIPALEKAIEGMKVGETKHIVIPPEEGYGKINKDAFKEFSKEQIPKDALKVGTILQARGPKGEIFYARVAEIKEKTVVLDFNHPLAGKTLYFDVKILDVQPVEKK
jgi:FKBP-type peptidyl-prolyl cis-trans isomerase SlyD